MKMEISKEQQTGININKYSLVALEVCSQHQNENNIDSSHQSFELPIDFVIVPSIADGSCFFDSFGKGLNTLGKHVSVEELRLKCKELAQSDPPEWFINSIFNSYDQDGRVRKETRENYIKNILCTNRWGDPDIEGRILCGFYKVSLYIIEKHEVVGQEMYIYQIINEEGSKSIDNIDYYKENTVYIINQGKGHFEPLLKISKVNNDQFETLISMKNDDSQSKEEGTSLTSVEGVSPSTNDKIVSSTDDKIYLVNKIEKQSILKLNIETIRVIIDTFNKFEDVIKEDDITKLQNLIQFIYKTIDKTMLKELYKESGNSLKNTHLITLACKYNKIQVLDFLLHKSTILCYLPSEDYNTYNNALCHTIRFYNIHMLEMLYNHWSGVIHWSGHMASCDLRDTIPKLIKLKKILIYVQQTCQVALLKDQQMMVDVYCIIYFNSFQIELYSELIKVMTDSTNSNCKELAEDEIRKNEIKATAAMLLTVFRVYEKYSNKDIRLPKTLAYVEQNFKNLFKDESSIYMKYQLYLMYEVYYRKLDFNISLLIIDNLYVLKQRLELPADTYQHLECALFYFIYRVNEDWRLYLPQNRPIYKNSIALDKYCSIYVKTNYDPHRLYNGPVLYLERVKFLKSLLTFKASLERSMINIENSNGIRGKSTKMPTEDINSLLHLCYLRDDYSLKKILHYTEAISLVDFNTDKKCSFLIIERIIQVIGEFIKGTMDSFHLSSTTVILLQLEIPRETYKTLTKLRDEMSHVKNGELLKRIEIETNDEDIFEKASQDLQKVKKVIEDVIEIYKPILEKSLVKTGIDLIEQRYAELPENTKDYHQLIKEMYGSFNVDSYSYINFENSFITETWENLGFSRILLREIGAISMNIDELRSKLESLCKNIFYITISKLPKYTDYIFDTLQAINKDNNRWCTITKKIPADIFISCSDYPNTEDVKKIKKVLSKKEKRIFKKLNLVRDWMPQWEGIKKILVLSMEEANIFRNNHLEMKASKFSNLYQKICDSFPDKEGVKSLYILINEIQEQSKRYSKKSTTSIIDENRLKNDYQGINAFLNKLSQNIFFTQNEKDLLKSSTNDSCECDAQSFSSCQHQDIYNKIYNNVPITEQEYERIKSSKLNDKSKKICENYFLGKKRDPNLLECLVNRINLLKTVLGDTNDQNQHILRYKHDEKFRITIEMILIDIMNLLKTCKLNKLLEKSSNLLKEINLRNVLEHGNPLLDVIGNALDSNDMPTEMVSFALTVLKDEACINKIYTLYENGANAENIKNNYCQPNCGKCASYSKLIRVQQTKLVNNKAMQIKQNENDEHKEEIKLLNAVKKDDKAIVQNVMHEGANVNYVDSYGKSALHYAALSGKTDLIELLLKYKANINIVNEKDGNSPLHYAFMNGNKDSKDMLIFNGADVTLTNNIGVKPSEVIQGAKKKKR